MIVHSPDINWPAINRVRREFMQDHNRWDFNEYREYMLNTWGIDHSNEYIKIVDEQKYMLFVLRFS